MGEWNSNWVTLLPQSPPFPLPWHYLFSSSTAWSGRSKSARNWESLASFPIIARRSEVHLVAAAAGRRERWQRIASQAAEQSRQLAPPVVAAVVKLRDLVAIAGDVRILLAESGSQGMLSDAFPSLSASQDVVLAVGPEGGWAEAEVKLFAGAGWELASLGKQVLRAETAAIVALALISSRLQGSPL
jgi:16S rRNA (uracil1498-N3)-methyltransferase